jgi:hypothetical protein
MAARKMTAPNSKVRAFHVESVCDKYSLQSSGFGLVWGEAGSTVRSGEVLVDEHDDEDGLCG